MLPLEDTADSGVVSQWCSNPSELNSIKTISARQVVNLSVMDIKLTLGSMNVCFLAAFSNCFQRAWSILLTASHFLSLYASCVFCRCLQSNFAWELKSSQHHLHLMWHVTCDSYLNRKYSKSISPLSEGVMLDLCFPVSKLLKNSSVPEQVFCLSIMSIVVWCAIMYSCCINFCSSIAQFCQNHNLKTFL